MVVRTVQAVERQLKTKLKYNAKRDAKTAAMRNEAGGKKRQPKKAKLDEAGLNSSA